MTRRREISRRTSKTKAPTGRLLAPLLTACRFIVEAVKKHMIDDDVRHPQLPLTASPTPCC